MLRRYGLFLAGVLILSAGLILQGCDEPETKEDIMNVALSQMDAGDCYNAEQTLLNMGRDSLGYDGRTLLGWAQLCVGGATLNKVFKTLLTYNSSSSSDFAVVGDLANNLVPGTDAKVAKIREAYATFRDATPLNTAQIKERAVNMALASIITAASILAKNTGNDSTVSRVDISQTTCVSDASNCTGTANCTVGISSGDVADIANAVDQAATDAGTQSELGKIKDLASTLGAQADATAINATRCVIFNQMFKN